GFGVLAVDVVRVAGGHQRQAHLPRNFDRPGERQLLNLQTVVLDFNKVPLAEDLVEPGGDLPGFREIERRIAAAEDRAAELARHAAAQTNQPFAVGLEQLLVDSWLAVKAFEKRGRSQLD